VDLPLAELLSRCAELCPVVADTANQIARLLQRDSVLRCEVLHLILLAACHLSLIRRPARALIVRHGLGRRASERDDVAASGTLAVNQARAIAIVVGVAPGGSLNGRLIELRFAHYRVGNLGGWGCIGRRGYDYRGRRLIHDGRRSFGGLDGSVFDGAADKRSCSDSEANRDGFHEELLLLPVTSSEAVSSAWIVAASVVSEPCGSRYELRRSSTAGHERAHR